MILSLLSGSVIILYGSTINKKFEDLLIWIRFFLVAEYKDGTFYAMEFHTRIYPE